MKAWSSTLDPDQSSKITFLADPSGAFTRALELEFNSAHVFGQNRSKRYALTVENGQVKDVFVEPDNTGVVGKSSPLEEDAMGMRWLTSPSYLVSAAEKVLG